MYLNIAWRVPFAYRLLPIAHGLLPIAYCILHLASCSHELSAQELFMFAYLS